MIAEAIAGLMVGGGALGLAASLFPRPEPLEAVLHRFQPKPSVAIPVDGNGDMSWDNRLGAAALRHVRPFASVVARARADLRTLGRRPEDYAGEMVVYALFGFMLGPWLGAVAWFAGAPYPAGLSGAVSLIGTLGGALSPWMNVRDRARARRAAFLRALVAYCHVCAMSLASGRGVEQAMATAAGAGDGWAFNEIRACLAAGSLRGETPWESLDRLGHDLVIEDLIQLASTIAMAGEDGAAVRQTISTKARTISERISADAEQRTQRSTAQMGLPAVAIAAGFLVFLGYPALDALLSAF